MHETYKGKADGTFRGGQGVAQLDPVVMISAMAAATKSVSFGVTGSTTYIHVLHILEPFCLLCELKLTLQIAVSTRSNLGNLGPHDWRPCSMECSHKL